MKIKISKIERSSIHLEIKEDTNLGKYLLMIRGNIIWLDDLPVLAGAKVTLVGKRQPGHYNSESYKIPCLTYYGIGDTIVLIEAGDWQFAERELWNA